MTALSAFTWPKTQIRGKRACYTSAAPNIREALALFARYSRIANEAVRIKNAHGPEGPCRRSEKALGQDPDSWRFAACCRTSDRTPPSSRTEAKFTPIPRLVQSAFSDSRRRKRFNSATRWVGGGRPSPVLRALMSASQERRDGLSRTPWVASNAAMRFSMRTRSCTRNSRSRCSRFASSSSTDGTTTVRQAPGSPANFAAKTRRSPTASSRSVLVRRAPRVTNMLVGSTTWLITPCVERSRCDQIHPARPQSSGRQAWTRHQKDPAGGAG